MNQAIVAAVQVCLSLAHPQALNGTLQYVYPPGYERCGSLMQELEAENKADALESQAKQADAARKIYEAGVAALPPLETTP